MFPCFVFSGHQCLCSGERHRPGAIPDQWTLLWIGQCEYQPLINQFSFSYYQKQTWPQWVTSTHRPLCFIYIEFKKIKDLMPTSCLCTPSSSQFGNTCYCNSVLQALYFCRPFRENVLAYKAQQKKKENLLTCLADLFHSIATQKKKVGVIPPKKFISRLRKENGENASDEILKPL